MENGKFKLNPELAKAISLTACHVRDELTHLLYCMSAYLNSSSEDICILSGARDIADEIYTQLYQIFITRN